MLRSQAPATAIPGLLGDASELTSVITFIRGIGISVSAAELVKECVLPAIAIRDGGIFYDPGQRGWVSDLLHEAGHLAVSDPDRSAALSVIEDDPAEEMATLAWSYAAAVFIGMPIEVLFHPAYKAGSQCLVDAFGNGAYIGLPMLQYWGMATRSGEDGPPYPAMRRWTRAPSAF